MNEIEKQNTQKLMEYLHTDFVAWRDQREAEQSGLWNDPVTEKDWCLQRLGVAYESFNRWKNGHSPVGSLNALRIAIHIGNQRPLEIMGFDPVPADLWDILVSLPNADPADREAIRAILKGGVKQVLYPMQGD